jgi:hypothetical protein
MKARINLKKLYHKVKKFIAMHLSNSQKEHCIFAGINVPRHGKMKYPVGIQDFKSIR